MRVWDNGEGKGVSDLKTGKAAVENGNAKTRGFAGQVGTYELLYEHTKNDLLTADPEIIGLKTAGKVQTATTAIPGAKALVIGDEDNPGLLDYAKMFFKSGLFPPNPSSFLCNPNYCAKWKTCAHHP